MAIEKKSKAKPMPEKRIIDLGASMDQIFENTSIGSMERSIGNSLRGLNARTKRGFLPKSRSSQGYVFFTRPLMNLSDYNISNSRRFFPLIKSKEDSYQRYVRMMLDPRLYWTMDMRCPFVNNQSAFIPILSNTLIDLSGWPDDELPVYSTTPGHFGEQQSFTDGHTNEYNSYDLTATFRDTIGNPVLFLMAMWYYYQTYVFQGILQPYVDMITENEIDYNTAIYRVITDPTNRYVTNIARCGWAFPTSLPLGSIYDYNIEKPYSDSDADLSVRFKCNMFLWGDDVIKLEFNQTQALFSGAARRLLYHDLVSNNSEYVRRNEPNRSYYMNDAGIAKVPHHVLAEGERSYLNNSFFKLNYRMFPYINLITNELEWWTNKEYLIRDQIGRAEEKKQYDY